MRTRAAAQRHAHSPLHLLHEHFSKKLSSFHPEQAFRVVYPYVGKIDISVILGITFFSPLFPNQ